MVGVCAGVVVGDALGLPLRDDGLADDLAAAVALHEPPGAVGEGRQDFYGGAHGSTPSASAISATVGQG